MAEKTVTERTAEDAVFEASQIKHVVVEDADTSVATSETAQAVTEKATVIKATGGEVCFECGRDCPEA